MGKRLKGPLGLVDLDASIKIKLRGERVAGADSNVELTLGHFRGVFGEGDHEESAHIGIPAMPQVTSKIRTSITDLDSSRPSYKYEKN